MPSRCTEGRQRRFVWTILIVNFLLVCSSGSSKPVNIVQRNVTSPLEQPPALLTFDDLMKYTTMCSVDDDAGYFRDVILKPMLQVRVSGTETNARVRQHIKSQMLELGWHVAEDAFEANTPLGRRQFTNVVADLDPRSRSRLTLACHYDSKWFGTDSNSAADGGFIGATDAAVSCAMMIDLATCLNSTLHNVNSASQTSLQLIFFDGEEAFVSWSEADSLYGSRHLAELMETQRLPTPVNGNLDGRISQLDTMNLMILLDLIGSRDTQFVNWFQETSAFYNRLSQIETELRQAGLLSDGRYFFESSGRPLGRLLEDDHVPFLVRGVPVLHLISYPFPYVWHTEADNETALDYATINDVARILRVFVAEYLGLHGVSIASQSSIVAETAM